MNAQVFLDDLISEGGCSPGVLASGARVSRLCPVEMQREVWRLSDFVLQKTLYEGYSSSVTQAYDKVSGISVALKIYHKQRLSELNRAQVEREISIHLGLQHMHIIQMYAAWEDNARYYLIQELAEEGDVFNEVHRRGGQMTEKAAVSLVLQPFLAALHYLHTRDIIHRDIKPENLLFAHGKQIKVADFGLAIDHSVERPVTRAGTLDYMAPEVVICPSKRYPNENKENVNLAYTDQVDSWSVGILAYELVVGFPPFERESRQGTIESILQADPQFPAWMSEDAVDFIRRALVKDQRHRPSIPEMLRHPWVQVHERRRSHRSLPTNLLWRNMAHSPRGEPIAADIESLVAPVSHLRHTTSFQNHSWSAFPQDVAAPLLLDPVAMVGTREVQRNGSDVIKTGKGMEHTLTQPGMPLPMSMGMD
eukprot:CAMPEP_0177770836 /NCGR_PEP_ID=MMETSP0491_2-20121128/11184_1 /TAXON_ID=63592 /ORGANISM="Tetraselmis chuii, Strain PLY429" /LENGTH=421 /DNA_ID=CAMNT_0019288171 /DNA_START=212 /DNA_END=1477 /DNA_ORIENTATION=-